MRKLFITSLVGLFAYPLSGQQMPQQVINSSGTTFQAAAFSLSFNVGQTVTTTLANDQNTLSQGFLQPLKTDVPTSLLPFVELDGNYSVFPSLFTEGVNFEFPDKTLEIQKFEIYANDGRLVKSINQPQNSLNLSELSNGIYWLRPIVTNKQFGLKKVIKTL
jgi:Secretion system C-terminal sorting domain